MQNKSLAGVSFKDAGHGQVEAVFATLNVKDKDGDVTVKGAFQSGSPVKISAYNHASWQGALPIGKGTIHEEGEHVVFRGEFFDTQAAQDTRKTLAGLGDMGEWSYGFDVLKSEPGDFKGEQVRYLKSMRVHEVSPVMIGAGVGTHTRSVKGDDTTLTEAVEAALKVIERAERVEALRAEKGLALTGATRSSLEGLDEAIRRMHGLLNKEESNENEGEPERDVAAEMQHEFLQFVSATHEEVDENG